MDASRIDISSTFGAAYIGGMIMMLLYGITTLQTYMYYVRFPEDSKYVKILVFALWTLDTLHIALVNHAMYYYLITNYSSPSELVDGTWSLYVSVGVNVTIAFLVQCFFTHKLHGLSRGKWWLTGIISLAVLAHFCFGMETMIELLIRVRLDRISEITLTAAMPFAITAVLSDILIAAALCILLYSNKTDFTQTNVLINYLIIYAINRCLLTSVVAIVEVITFAVMPHSFWFLGIDFVVGKLYANSLLATLNTRGVLRSRDTEAEIDLSDSAQEIRTGVSLHARVTHSMLGRARRSKSGRASPSFAPFTTKSTMSTSTGIHRDAKEELSSPDGSNPGDVLEVVNVQDREYRSRSR